MSGGLILTIPRRRLSAPRNLPWNVPSSGRLALSRVIEEQAGSGLDDEMPLQSSNLSIVTTCQFSNISHSQSLGQRTPVTECQCAKILRRKYIARMFPEFLTVTRLPSTDQGIDIHCHYNIQFQVATVLEQSLIARV